MIPTPTSAVSRSVPAAQTSGFVQECAFNDVSSCTEQEGCQVFQNSVCIDPNRPRCPQFELSFEVETLCTNTNGCVYNTEPCIALRSVHHLLATSSVTSRRRAPTRQVVCSAMTLPAMTSTTISALAHLTVLMIVPTGATPTVAHVRKEQPNRNLVHSLWNKDPVNPKAPAFGRSIPAVTATAKRPQAMIEQVLKLLWFASRLTCNPVATTEAIDCNLFLSTLSCSGSCLWTMATTTAETGSCGELGCSSKFGSSCTDDIRCDNDIGFCYDKTNPDCGLFFEETVCTEKGCDYLGNSCVAKGVAVKYYVFSLFV